MSLDLNYDKDSKERMPWEHYLKEYEEADPFEISNRLEIPYDEEKKEFTLYFLGVTYRIGFPSFEIISKEGVLAYDPLEEDTYARILVIRYLLKARVADYTRDFLTYREMPWGEVYYKQFHGRCILRLAYGFGNQTKRFGQIMEQLGANPLKYGDVSYELELFDNLFVRFILWEGDDEFPPSSQILFSSNSPAAFAAEDMAVIGDVCINTFKALDKLLQG